MSTASACSVACIVEGHGEVSALPILLRRLAERIAAEVYIDVLTPIRVRRDRFLRNEDEFRRMLLLAVNKCPPDGRILIILDADDDCPVTLAADIAARARPIISMHNVSIVIANREYEAWFIAAAASLAASRGIVLLPAALPDADSPRNAKRWVETELMNGIYGETTDQPRLTAAMDLGEALLRSRSFRKLHKEVGLWLAPPTMTETG